MPDIRYIDKDFVRFRFSGFGGNQEQAILAFGDKVEVLQEGAGSMPSRVRALELFDGTLEGTVAGKPFRGREKGVLKFSMVDVQQGDGMVLETPPDENHQTRLVFIDGGDNKLFARHVAARYRHRQSSATNPLEVDLILITHGDADHFEGLIDIKRSETERNISDRKRLFIHPRRVYHNGLVKAPEAVPELKRLGRTVNNNGTPMIVDLHDDPRNAPTDMQNGPFKRWANALSLWEQRGAIAFKRVAHGMEADNLFGFLGPAVKVEIQGPFTSKVTEDGQSKDALPFLHDPPKSALIHLEEGTNASSDDFSVSHTINGHSIAFRLTYGNVRFNFTGDLNQESMALMREKIHVGRAGGRDRQSSTPRLRRLRLQSAEGDEACGLADLIGRRERRQGAHPPAGNSCVRSWQGQPRRNGGRPLHRVGRILRQARSLPRTAADSQVLRRRRGNHAGGVT